MTVINMRVGLQLTGLQYLCRYVKAKLGDNLLIVEIGSYAGANTSVIAGEFPKSAIVAVDQWLPYTEDGSTYDLAAQGEELKEAEAVFDSNRPGNVKKMKMTGVQYADSLPAHCVDWGYIDACHSYAAVLADLDSLVPKISPYGIISGHDFHWDTVKRAVIQWFGKHPDQVFVDGSWAYRVPA